MRFPDIPWMKPVMDLFTELGLDNVKIPYIMSVDDNINFFNGERLTNAQLQIKGQAKEYDPFRTQIKGITGTVDEMVKRQIEPFRTALKADFDKGWEALMKYDAWSTRGYMHLHGTAPYGTYDNQVRFALTALLIWWTHTTRYWQVISYLETFDTGTGLYDRALSETVMDSLDFDYDDDQTWYCIQ